MAQRQGKSKAHEDGQSKETRCEAVYRATLAISTELSLDAALQKIVDAARELVKARYAALGVVDEERRRLTRFIVSGVTDKEIRAIGHWPRGLGLLGELIHFPRPLRVREISKDPRSVGFPPNHPPMASFLGAPLILRGRILGNFYMTNKIGADEFSEDDEEILSLFAAHAAIAIENARLYTETDIRLKEKVTEVERAERQSRFLAELGAMLLRLPPGEDPALESIAEKATEPLGDVAAIYLVDPDNPDAVTASAVFHRIPARRDAAAEAVRTSWQRVKEQVIVHRRPTLSRETAAEGDSAAIEPGVLARHRFSAALAVPIATRQKTYGIFASLASHPVTLTEDDLRFATLIADRLGSALDSARLYRGELEARAQVERLADVAEQRATELETVLDTMAEAVFVVDSHMNLVRLNMAYARLVGLPGKGGAIGPLQQHIALLKPRAEGGRPLSPDELPMARALRGESLTNQVMLITPIGSTEERFLSVSGAPIRDTAGRVVAAVNVARDVTEMKEVDRLKDEFISVASHELRTPLTVIKGYAQILLLRLEAMPSKASESAMAKHIVDQTNRMATLADRLLDVSRIQFGRLALERQQIDLAKLVRDVSERMQVGIPDRTIRVSADQPIQASADAARLEQVITNLISNASKYSPEGTPIEVSLERRDGEALISVRDYGPGIPEEHRQRIFQRFFRVPTAEAKAGLGLGLYVSKGIVEAHGGKIWFDTEIGKGTTFRVLLPTQGTGDGGRGSGKEGQR